MNKEIRLLIEGFFDDNIFKPNDINQDIENVGNSILYTYYPKDRNDLKILIEQLLNERGKDADLNDIDTSEITDMSNLFSYLEVYNIDISNWDVSNVTNMSNMFYGCYNFNGNLSNWDVRKVTDMYSMFYHCNEFNCNLNKWNVGNVTDMSWMFCNCTQFNSKLSKWNIGNVTNMSWMFYNCINFRGKGLDNWKPIKCENMNHMFDNNKKLKNKPSWYPL